MMDLAILIDEANLNVRGVGLNPRLEEALDLVERSPADGYALLQTGQDEVGQWLVDNATAVARPVVIYGRPAAVLYQALLARTQFSPGRAIASRYWSYPNLSSRADAGSEGSRFSIARTRFFVARKLRSLLRMTVFGKIVYLFVIEMASYVVAREFSTLHGNQT